MQHSAMSAALLVRKVIVLMFASSILNGIVMRPSSSLRLGVPFQTFRTIQLGMFGHILSQICGNNFMVLKVTPLLVIMEAQPEKYLDAVEAVMGGSFFERLLV